MKRRNPPAKLMLLVCGLGLLLGVGRGVMSPPTAWGGPGGGVTTPTPDGDPPPSSTPRPTATSKPSPTPTATPGRASPTPSPTLTPLTMPSPTPTSLPGSPSPTTGPGNVYLVDVCDDPPAPIPPPWQGVVDYLVENRCVTQGGTTRCYGVWIANTHESLFENKALRIPNVLKSPVSQGDMCPEHPADDVHITRPECLINDEWWYVPGSWYYNGLSEPLVDSSPYSVRTIPEDGYTIVVRYYHASVPEPAYPGATAWNFGATGTCQNLGSGDPIPTPAAPPPPPPTPAAACPSCAVQVSPRGSLETPYLTPFQAITLTWNCGYPSGQNLVGYTVRVEISDGGSSWWHYDTWDVSPGSGRRLTVAVIPGFLYHARVDARFDVGGEEEICCVGQTYYRYSLLLPPLTASLEARAEYWSEHDTDPNRGPANPYRTTGPHLQWNYGEVLHVHPSAHWEVPEYAGWASDTQILAWRYLGTQMGVRHVPAVCQPPGAPSCGWQEESPRRYVHLRWYKTLLPGETEGVAEGNERTWLYRTDPITLTFSYQVRAETTWTHLETGTTVGWPFTETLTMTVRLRYLTTYRHR